MYFKLLETFVLKILFSKDEYNITSKNFNPVRFFAITFLVLNLFLTVYLLSRLNHIYKKVELMCPAAITELAKKPPTKDTKDTKEITVQAKK